MSNPMRLKLYEPKNKDEEKAGRKCRRELRLAWREFARTVEIIQWKYERLGALDTDSREAYCDWVEKENDDGHLMWPR